MRGTQTNMNNEAGFAAFGLGFVIAIFLMLALALEAQFGHGTALPMFLLLMVTAGVWIIILMAAGDNDE